MKPLYHSMNHAGQPDLTALYRVPKIPAINKDSYQGWNDPLGLPTEQWYHGLAANAVSPSGIVFVDHETWLYGTQAERIDTANKYVIVRNGIKAVRPDLKVAFYGEPIRRVWWAPAMTEPGSPQWLAWQAENNDIASILGPVLDIYAPSLYCYHTKAANPSEVLLTGRYLQAQLREAARVKRLYGRPDALILPFIWYMRHDQASPLDIEYWEMVLRICLDEDHGNDGAILWSPWGVPWDENAPWWVTIKARLTDKRRTQ